MIRKTCYEGLTVSTHEVEFGSPGFLSEVQLKGQISINCENSVPVQAMCRQLRMKVESGLPYKSSRMGR